MGKWIIPRRRGKGGGQFRAPSKGKFGPARYPPLSQQTVTAEVVDILHETGRDAPLARIRTLEGSVHVIPSALGTTVGKTLEIGEDAELINGNILPLSRIPDGSTISNVELRPGDGGVLAKSAGASAVLFSRGANDAIVTLPSGKQVVLSLKCRATLGAMAGGGRGEKPFLKAGARWADMRSRRRLYPKVRGVAMAAVHHPFGGGRHQHPGKSTSTSRNAPPGRKVGLIAPRKSGRKRLPRAPVG